MKAIAACWLALLMLAGATYAQPPKSAEPKKPVEQKPLDKKAVQSKAEAKPAAQSATDTYCGVLAGETPSAIKIENILDEPTEIEVIEAPLTDVIEYLKSRHHIEIQLDNKSLEEAGVATDTQITRNLKGISLRSALRLILRDLELTYVIRDDVLLITTVSNAETIMETRVYPVGDLLHGPARVSDRVAAETLMELIQAVVAPTTWSEVGGTGSIKYWPEGQSLVASQTADVQGELCHLLAAMRKLRSQHPAPPVQESSSGRSGEVYVAVYRLPYRVTNVMAATMLSPPVQKDQKDTGGSARPLSPAREIAEDLALAIPRLIEPQTWKQAAGAKPTSGPKNASADTAVGTIEVVGNELLVRQFGQVHQQIVELLETLTAANEGASGPFTSWPVSASGPGRPYSPPAGGMF